MLVIEHSGFGADDNLGHSRTRTVCTEYMSTLCGSGVKSSTSPNVLVLRLRLPECESYGDSEVWYILSGFLSDVQNLLCGMAYST